MAALRFCFSSSSSAAASSVCSLSSRNWREKNLPISPNRLATRSILLHMYRSQPTNGWGQPPCGRLRLTQRATRSAAQRSPLFGLIQLSLAVIIGLQPIAARAGRLVLIVHNESLIRLTCLAVSLLHSTAQHSTAQHSTAQHTPSRSAASGHLQRSSYAAKAQVEAYFALLRRRTTICGFV